MTMKVAMYEGSYRHIEDKLAALNLDIEVLTFNSDGRVLIHGVSTDAAEVHADFLWFSQHVSATAI